MNDNVKVIRVGSRKSELALIQTKYVISSLQKLFPTEKFEIHTMTTMGDRVLNISLPKIGEKALFTKDLEDALTNGSVDFVVHSLKDLPTCLPAGMAIGAVLEREDPRDALVLNKKFEGKTLATLPEGSIVGTSSLRRGAQLARCYPHLVVQDIRGNLNTRLAKLDADNSKFAGIILAQAGLVRMGWEERISQTIDPTDILYAVGQGALAVECRASDTRILKMLQKLACLETQCKILTERSFLKTLGGGCSAPVAVHTNLERRNGSDDDYELNITGAVWSLDGKIEIQSNTNCILELDDNANEVIPRKRCRMMEIWDQDESPTKPIRTSPKADSPPIVDDSKATSSNSTGKFDIEALINIHGEAFKKCPYSEALNENKQHLKPSVRDCPLHIPVGQDVMGECPYVDTNQKVLSVGEMTPTLTEGNIAKCPFFSSAKEDTVARSETVAQKCPFVCELGGGDSKDTETSTDQPLYCGLYRHECYRLDIFEKCEALGKSLATSLIENGALKVMSKAQLEIRQKI
ncbi:Porphobilinogen deaminase [Pseudolycoriella hygida]|uniref:hydroxymethylbilane synthase n=1 Tax=Pseudolycoriella hygida TaxID=35572 RepID=A0A9Q0NC96_9DIPT|nr:Porphobilinogen deaminase [Pseudolycoriella hygida]